MLLWEEALSRHFEAPESIPLARMASGTQQQMNSKLSNGGAIDRGSISPSPRDLHLAYGFKSQILATVAMKH